MLRFCLVLAALSTIASPPAQAQFGPAARMEGVEIRRLASIPSGGRSVNRHPVRIDRNPTDGRLYVLATSQADGRGPGSTNVIYRLDAVPGGTLNSVPVLTGDDHGTPRPVGMTFGPDGALYLVGNNEVGDPAAQNAQTQIVIRRGMRTDGEWNWETVATSEPYLFSYTYFDHRANAIVVTPDGQSLLVNSGSRTDHGESYGGVREEALTSVLLRIPADATNLVLPNDRQALRDGGYVYAEGNRNTADLAFAPNGDLIGPDNAGDRDDPGELNWLREGEHYGFPWRIGGNDTPMQFDGYDPAADPLVPSPCNPNPADTGCYFSNDPGYPAPPEGVTFVEPIPNVGPYADKFLDPQTGAVRDASEEGIAITTVSGGRSPLGIVFDADSVLTDGLRGNGFMLSFAGDRGDFPLDGQDLISLNLDKTDGAYTVSTELVADGFTHPIDAAMIENVVYVLEYGDWFSAGGSRGVWAVSLPLGQGTSVEPALPSASVEAYPNPAAGAFTVTYRLPATTVEVELVDVLGRVVRTIERPGGDGRVEIETDGLSVGVYVVRLTAGDVRTSRTITLAR